VPPGVKNLWTPKDRRGMGAVMLIPAIVYLVVELRRGDVDIDKVIMAGALLAAWVGFALFLLLAPSGRTKPPSRKS
jgi:hypothetical protein